MIPEYRPSYQWRALRGSLLALNWSASFRAVFDTFCAAGGFIFVKYALSLGVPGEKMGYLTSLVSMACLLQIVGVPWISRAADKKRLIIKISAIEPVIMIAAVFTAPLLPPGSRFFFLALAVFMAAACLFLTKPATDEWLASLIPAGIRGRYLGKRLQFQGVVAIASMLAAGFLAARVARGSPWILAMLLAIGGLFGLLAVTAMARARMAGVAASKLSWRAISSVLRERPFIMLLAAIVIMQTPFIIACPYYQVFYLNELRMPEDHIAWMLCGYYIVRVLSLPFWGRMADRLGPRSAFLRALPIYMVFFLAFVIVSPRLVWPLYLAWALVGLADAAWNVALNSALFGTVPKKAVSRDAFFAVFNLVILLWTAVGAALAVPLLGFLKGMSFTIRGHELGQYHLLFLLSAALCLAGFAGLGFIPGLREKSRGYKTIQPKSGS